MYNICIYGNPLLRKKAIKIPLTAIPSFRSVAAMMFETMYANQGIGLSAQQAGLAEQIVVIDTREQNAEQIVMINPEIIAMGEETVSAEEGCLSFPNIRGDIVRPKEIEVRFYDLDGRLHEEKLTGLLARVAQHEIDHLNGILFIDRMSSAKRLILKKKLTRLKLLEKKEELL